MKLSVILLVVCLSEFADASAPSFQQQFPYFFYVEENSPKGYLIGYVNASVANSNQQITYETSDISNHVIMIDNTTGALYVNGSIDADIPDLHDIQFSVYAYINPDEKKSIKVYIIINDVNDNLPVFQNQPYKVNISEDFPVNTYVTRIQATDVDRKGYSELIYNIEGWTKDSMFFIKEFDGTIWTNKRLDYENTKIHNLNVSVTDGRPSDKSRHFVYTTVEIFVNDHDDQGAKFDQYNYYCSIQEGLHNATKLIQVHASDLDKGINSPVTYSIYQGSNPGGIYKIDTITGTISVQGTIDREATGSSFYLTVQATSTIHEPATATIVISINDTNDNAPFFSSDHYTGNVLENSLIGSKVVQVSAVDLDEGPNKELAYSIIGGNGKFDIDSNGFVMVNGSLDRETVNIYHFQVHAIEISTKEKFNNSTNVTIFIKDINDNSPKFAKNFFEFEVEEEVMAPVFISQLNATDRDYGLNGFIEFSIIPDAENKHEDFFIEPLTGKLFTQRKLDRERIALYSILVKAMDRADPGQRRETLCTVKVKVQDINDNVPYFSENDYVASVNEAANLNTIVFALQAYDKDIGLHAKLEYEIAPSNISEYFKIDPMSGIIKTSKELDREKISIFHLHVIVKDGGNKSSTTNVTIIILDINDNSPVFTNSNGYQFNVTEGKVGEVVGVVQAYDIDEGDAGKVKYIVTDSDNFIIDNHNGTITTAKKLDRELAGTYRITVVAEDLSRIGSRNSYTQVDIKVIDENDNAPEFPTGGDLSTVIRKESTAGTYVYQFAATDKDAGENGRVTYILAHQFKETFSLDNSTGILRIQSSLSNYTNESIIVKVFARDYGVPSLISSAQLRIYFANVLKSAPVFEKPFVTMTVKENESKGKLIVDVNANYHGQWDEKNFKYSIVHGDISAFRMDEETGQITTLRPLDREIAKKYILIIMVQLRLRNEANFATVEINVADVNDNPPQFLEEVVQVNVYENQDNITLATIFGIDKDDGINSKIAFYLNGSKSFKIDRDSGVLSTTRSLDRESVAEYNLSVTAVNDYAIPKLNSSCRVIVNVLDLNDNAPVFEKNVYHTTIVENSPVNTSVLQVKAIDHDDGINSFIKYDIEENNCFYIDWKSGIIRTACMVDREKTPSFELALIAKGIASPPLSSTARLKVNVTDVDDNHPHFPTKLFRLTPSENLAVGSKLIKFDTVDADAFAGHVFFELHAGNDDGQFLLNTQTGTLTLAKHLDREVKSAFTLEVRVYNQMNARMKRTIAGSKSHYDQATVLISIQDINDNSPFFVKINHIAAIREDAEFKTFVAKINANDSDVGNYGSMSYKIESGNDNGLFHLDRQSGIVTVYKSLMGDAGNVTKISISAVDNNGAIPSNPSTNKAILHIYVIGNEQTGIVSIETTVVYLYGQLQFIESLLSNATEAKVKIDKVKPTANKNMFYIYFHAIDEGRRHILNKAELRKSIVTPKSQYVSNQMKRYNVTWYFEAEPKAAKSADEKESNYEIYIGVIAAITILLIITCAFAIWAGISKKNGRVKQREIDDETRTNTLEKIQNGYSVDSVKSARSGNRYIIEPYESNEQFEKDDQRQSTEDQSGLNSSPFYTVEAHEVVDMGTQRDYFDSSATSHWTNSWAYGDNDSLGSQDDMDRIVAEKKLSNFQSLQTGVDLEEENETSVVSNDIIGAGGPLFTSERMNECVQRENTNNNDINIDGVDDQESCEIDGSYNPCGSSVEKSTNEMMDKCSYIQSTTDNQRNESYDSNNTDDSPLPASSPSFLQFDSIEWEPTNVSGLCSPRLGVSSSLDDTNENKVYSEMVSFHNSQLTSLKTKDVLKNIDSEHMVSHL